MEQNNITNNSNMAKNHTTDKILKRKSPKRKRRTHMRI